MKEKEDSQEIEQITKKDMRRVYWRSFFIKSTQNYERFMAVGFAFALIPIIKKLYKNTEDRISALNRHLEMFNTHPWMANPILGVVSVMEEQHAQSGKMEKAINNIKVGLMGPLAGIGDSLFWGTIRAILLSIGAGLALQGSILGPVLFLVLWNILNFGFRYWSLMYGRKTGLNLLHQMEESNIVQKISEGASVLGLLVLGVLVSDWVNISTPLEYTTGEETNSVQEVLDSIMPSMLPLTATLIIIFLLRRNITPNKILIGIFVIAFLLGGPGILTN